MLREEIERMQIIPLEDLKRTLQQALIDEENNDEQDSKSEVKDYPLETSLINILDSEPKHD